MTAGDTRRYCGEMLKRSGSSFATAFRLLPERQCRAMTAFYAFCRVVDDIADGGGEDAGGPADLDGWRREIDSVFSGTPSHPVSIELSEAVSEFGIRKEHLMKVIDGVERDLETNRYETFEDLYDYCFHVASTVGLVCVTVLGERSREVELYAELTGIAVQLTNIIRDVREDAGLGRIYLPIEDLVQFGVTEEEIVSGVRNGAVADLMRFESDRAREYYRLAVAALPPASRRRLFFAEALRRTYRSLLDEILKRPQPGPKVSLPSRRKLAIALAERVHPGTWLWRAA